MSEAVGSAQGEGHPADVHLPAHFRYPLGAIVARVLVGLVILAIAALLVLTGGMVAIIFAILCIGFGGFTLLDNALALVDPARRSIHLSPDAIAIRYGLSERSYRFVDYAEFHVGKVGLRTMLTALPLDVGIGGPQGSASVLLKPAVIAPMPPFGGDAPESLAAWEALLKETRRAAVAARQKAGKIHLVDRTVA